MKGRRFNFPDAVNLAREQLRRNVGYGHLGHHAYRIDAIVYGLFKGDLAGETELAATDRDRWDSLNVVAQERMRDGRELPQDLATWIADVLADQLRGKKDPKRRPRPNSKAKSMRYPWRDHRLCNCIKFLRVVYGSDVKVTRGVNSPHRSLADVVAEAARVSYDLVVNAWAKRER